MSTDPAAQGQPDGRRLRAVPGVANERLTIAQAVRDAMRDEMARDRREAIEKTILEA